MARWVRDQDCRPILATRAHDSLYPAPSTLHPALTRHPGIYPSFHLSTATSSPLTYHARSSAKRTAKSVRWSGNSRWTGASFTTNGFRVRRPASAKITACCAGKRTMRAVPARRPPARSRPRRRYHRHCLRRTRCPRDGGWRWTKHGTCTTTTTPMAQCSGRGPPPPPRHRHHLPLPLPRLHRRSPPWPPPWPPPRPPPRPPPWCR